MNTLFPHHQKEEQILPAIDRFLSDEERDSVFATMQKILKTVALTSRFSKTNDFA